MSSPRKKHRFLNVLFLIFVLLVTLWLVLSSVYLILQNVASKEEKLSNFFTHSRSCEERMPVVSIRAAPAEMGASRSRSRLMAS